MLLVTRLRNINVTSFFANNMQLICVITFIAAMI